MSRRCKNTTLRWLVYSKESRAVARNKSLPESRNCSVCYNATIMSRASLSHRRTLCARSMRRCPSRRLCPLLPKATHLAQVHALRESAANQSRILGLNLAWPICILVVRISQGLKLMYCSLSTHAYRVEIRVH